MWFKRQIKNKAFQNMTLLLAGLTKYAALLTRVTGVFARNQKITLVNMGRMKLRPLQLNRKAFRCTITFLHGIRLLG